NSRTCCAGSRLPRFVVPFLRGERRAGLSSPRRKGPYSPRRRGVHEAARRTLMPVKSPCLHGEAGCLAAAGHCVIAEMQGVIQERQDRRILSAILSAGTEYVPLTMLLRICSTFAARVLEFQRGSRSVRSNEPFEPAER